MIESYLASRAPVRRFGGRVPSYAHSTLTPASATGTADGATTNLHTLTLYDSNGVLLPNRAVTFTTELTAVSASESSLTDDAAEIETTTGELNLTLTVRDANGVELPNIQPARIVYSSTGTGNTFGTPTATDRNGRSTCTFSSTVAEAKTISVTVDGVLVTQTAAVTVTGAPGPPALIWFSRFDNIGTNQAARQDGGPGTYKWDTAGGQLEVIANPGTLGFPATLPNILRVPWYVVSGNSILGKGGIYGPSFPTMAVGATRYFRYYFRLEQPDSTADLQTHPIQDGHAGSQTNWTHEVRNDVGAGVWQFGHDFWDGVSPNHTFTYPTPLDKQTTYRIEMALTLVTAGTFTFQTRIYDEAISTTVPIVTGADLRNADDSLSMDEFMASGTVPVNNAGSLNDFIAGVNDNSNDIAEAGNYAYQGAFAVSDVGWIGEYVHANG